MDDVGRGNYGLGRCLFVVAVLSAPSYVFEVFPVAAMIGSLIGLGSMGCAWRVDRDALASGFSLRQIILAVMKAGLV